MSEFVVKPRYEPTPEYLERQKIAYIIYHRFYHKYSPKKTEGEYCKSIICMEQQKKGVTVPTRYNKYKDLNMCMLCRTNWKKPTNRCPCCSTILRKFARQSKFREKVYIE